MAYFGQTIAEKLTQADAYYAVDNDIRAHDWAQYNDNEKKASLNQAEREVNLYLGIHLETLYSNIDWPINGAENFRPDYAVFEHALFILDNTARTKTDTSGAQLIESEEYQEEEKTQGVTMSPQAQRFLCLNRMQLQRG